MSAEHDKFHERAQAMPWKEAEAKLREHGVEYPWDPRDTLRFILKYEAAEAALGVLLKK